jgi:hypothetical protein
MTTIKGLYASINAELIKDILEEKGYRFFDGNKTLNVNIIGIRSAAHDSARFDDTLLLVYRDKNKEWAVESYEITTDPGPSILRKPINPDGTAILVPDQYRGVYKIGTHGGSLRHTALIQRGGPVRVYRDDDKDSQLEMDEDNIQKGMFGINIHRHSRAGEKEYVRGSSAGCQVFKNSKDFLHFLDICNESADIYGNSFTYTLLEEEDFQD